ncbi:hypothetical protein GCM10010967_29600 [Dyadobacter beijingensis]|uniref:Secreted protein (Por secretion system target) n=1 Tax=Dyadobacter beijingensis TaxID=365489 RepID=A0ABQ2HYG0_9BACT|nr:S8 family serine peptidase [Dyadobacter beijingensis]GGM94430.1 hypothetical protein GCM10010967_29600 [Dyadobacter beijingensis]
MKKTPLFYVCFLVLHVLGYVAVAQDMFHFANETQYPIYLSKKIALIQFYDQRQIENIPAANLADLAETIKIIEGIPGMAYVTFPDGMTKADMERSIQAIRTKPNIRSAHAMMTNVEGEEVAGFLDVLIVRLKANADFTLFQSVLNEKGLSIKDTDKFDNRIFYISGQSVLNNPISVCNELSSTKLLEFAQPNSLRYIKPAGTPADPLFSSQWGHTKMQIPEAWDITTGCSAIKIAIIDNGVQLNHPDLIDNLVFGYDATLGGTNGGAVAGEIPHGTKCAGIAAAASNGIGLAGAAYTCKIIPVRAYSTLGGNLSTDAFIATAINFAAGAADVISMSWTIVSASHPNVDLAITAAINNATTTGRANKGCVLVGAMGNDGTNIFTLPTRLPNVLAVGTSVQNDTKWSGTNTPTGTYKIDLVAPGPDVATITGSSYSNSPNDHRTSWSTPTIGGIAALILSANPSLTHQQVKRLIVETCEKVGGYSYIVGNSIKYVDLSHSTDMGHGRANAFKALEKAAGGPIVGPTLVCSTGNFSITSPIQGATLSWSTTNAGLTITNAGTATRQAGFNGEVTVIATITAPGSCPVTLIKKIHVGMPVLMNGYYVSNGAQYGLVESDESYPNTICWNANPTTGNVFTSILGSTSTSWTKISSTPIGLLWSSSGGNLCITFQSIGQQGIFKLNYSNACAALSKFYGLKSISCANFLVYPNPASDIVTFEFENTNDMDNLYHEIQLICEQSGRVVRTVNVSEIFKGKQFIEGNKVEINVSDLSRGVYYVHAIPGKTSKLKGESVRILLE